MAPDELGRLLNIINPDRILGKVVLICRYGYDNVRANLPNHIKAVRESGHRVVWCCDPMHGNTFTTDGGIKTRDFKDIVEVIYTLSNNFSGTNVEFYLP